MELKILHLPDTHGVHRRVVEYKVPADVLLHIGYPCDERLQHVPQIKAALGIAGAQTNVCSWFSRGTEERRGAQIDLVMQRITSNTR